MRGLQGCFHVLSNCLETVGCHLLVVAIGAGATPRHNGAGLALRSGFGLHNGVIQGEAGQNSLRTVEPAP